LKKARPSGEKEQRMKERGNERKERKGE